MDPSDVPRHRPLAFDKMETLIKEMQDPETGVPVRSQKLFLSVIPSAFMGYDLVEWLMDRFNLDETSNVEAINLANQLCQYGYFFPVNDLKYLILKDDSSLYRFQSAYYWPWQTARVAGSGSSAPSLGPDNIEYAIYLVKRTLRNKQRHALEEYELEALANLKKNLAAKWDFITMQAEEQVRLAKDRKKGDKIVSDSQERAYWRVARPPPGVPSALEPCPIPVRARNPRPKKRTIEQLTKEIEHLKTSADRTRVKTSIALEALMAYSETFAPYDPWLTPPQPSNPWISDDTLFWQINSPLVEVPSEKRVQRWALSIEELVSDPTGLQEFTSFLRKEYSHENIRFFLAVMDLRKSSNKQIPIKLQAIYEEFLKPGAPCEINIDGATADKVAEGLRSGSRYALDHAADHVYGLLLKKDCYPRFVRSDHFQRLLAEGRNVHQKKAKFFNFGGGQVKKKPGPTSGSSGSGAGAGAALSRRRGSDRSLSGSAHELAVCAVQAPRGTDPPPYSHSQSNLCDISRDPMDDYTDEAVPWESTSREGVYGARRRQDSAADSGSSSSDLSVVVSATERTRRLPQQSTLDGGLRGAPPPLRRLSAVEPRHLAPLASPPQSPRQPRLAASATGTPALPHPPPHPTPTISVSSAPDDDSPSGAASPERRSLAHSDEPSSVFATPTDPVRAIVERASSLDKTVSPLSCDSRTDVKVEVKVKRAESVSSDGREPTRADSKDSDRATTDDDEPARKTLSREPSTTRELSPTSCKDSSKIGDLPGSGPEKDDETRETGADTEIVAAAPSPSVSAASAPSPSGTTASLSSVTTAPPPSSVTTAPPPSVTIAPPSSVTTALPQSVTIAPPSSVTIAPPSSVTTAPPPSSVTTAPPPSVTIAPPSSVTTALPPSVTIAPPPSASVTTVPPPSSITTAPPPSSVTTAPPPSVTTAPPSSGTTAPSSSGTSTAPSPSAATVPPPSASTPSLSGKTVPAASGTSAPSPSEASTSSAPVSSSSEPQEPTSSAAVTPAISPLATTDTKVVEPESVEPLVSMGSIPRLPVAPLAVGEDIVDDDNVDKVPSAPAQRASGESETASESDATKKRIAHKDELSSVSESDIVKRDNKSELADRKQRNDVCPWEDENSSESDAPFVKTYATLGYL